jgi:hypothetical protein
VRNSKWMAVGLWLCVWFVASVRATTFEYTDGTKIEGDIVQGKPEFLQIRVEGSRYEKLAWDKLSQTTLKQLAGDPKLKLEPFIQPYLEVLEDASIKKTEVVIKPVPRLERPAKGSLFGALFGSSVGLVAMLLLYGANIYAGYEISVIRAYPAGLVCSIAAVAPVIGPAIFLCLPTKMQSAEEEVIPDATPPAVSAEADPAAAPKLGHGGLTLAHTEAAPAASTVPETQVFKRGQFTFNRRFIETKFAGFFGLVRRDAEKDLVLLIKSARGEFIATRISRIAASDLHAEVHRGGASQEVQIPFSEILEIQIKHRDA